MSIGGVLQGLLDKVNGTERTQQNMAAVEGIFKKVDGVMQRRIARGGQWSPDVMAKYDSLKSAYDGYYKSRIPQEQIDMRTGAAPSASRPRPKVTPTPPPSPSLDASREINVPSMMFGAVARRALGQDTGEAIVNATTSGAMSDFEGRPNLLDRSARVASKAITDRYAPVDQRDVDLAGPNPMYDYLLQSREENRASIPKARGIEHITDFAAETIPDLPLMEGAAAMGRGVVKGLGVGVQNALVAPGRAGASPQAIAALRKLVKTEASSKLRGELVGTAVGGAIYSQAEDYNSLKERAVWTILNTLAWPIMHLGFRRAGLAYKGLKNALQRWASSGLSEQDAKVIIKGINAARDEFRSKRPNGPTSPEEDAWWNDLKNAEDAVIVEEKNYLKGDVNPEPAPGSAAVDDSYNDALYDKYLDDSLDEVAAEYYAAQRASRALPAGQIPRALSPADASSVQPGPPSIQPGAMTRISGLLPDMTEPRLIGQRDAIADLLAERDYLQQSQKGQNLLRGDLAVDEWNSNYPVPKGKEVQAAPERGGAVVPYGTGNRALKKRIQEALRRARMAREGGSEVKKTGLGNDQAVAEGDSKKELNVGDTVPITVQQTPAKKPNKASSEQPMSLTKWVQKSGRIGTQYLGEFGITRKDNFGDFIALGGKNGLPPDDLAQSAIAEGIIPPNPSNVNPGEWLMQQIRQQRRKKPASVEGLVSDRDAAAADKYADLNAKAVKQFPGFKPDFAPGMEIAGTLPEGAVVATQGDVFRVEGDVPEGVKLKDGVEIVVDPWDEVEKIGAAGPRAKQITTDAIDLAVTRRERDKLIMAKGQYHTPGLRLGDQEASGEMAYAVEKGKAGIDAWNEWIDHARKENRFTDKNAPIIPPTPPKSAAEPKPTTRLESTEAGEQITPTELRPQAEIPKGKIGKTSEPIEGRGGVGMFGSEEKPADQPSLFEQPTEKPGDIITHSLIKTPTGKWHFVGKVDPRLVYNTPDGISLPDEVIREMKNSSNPALVMKKYGITNKVYDTKREALEAAEWYNIPVRVHDGESVTEFRPGKKEGAQESIEPVQNKSTETDKFIPNKSLAQAVYDMITAGKRIKDNRELDQLAEMAWLSTKASGAYDSSDVYEALEAGVNKWIMKNAEHLIWNLTPKEAEKVLEDLLKMIPTQTHRTAEKDLLQQFSTPPPIGLVTAIALKPGKGDVILEPSAGIGGLAVFAKGLGATVYANEIDPKRRAMLEWLGFEVSNHDAEFIDDLLPDSIKPNGVLMNPPFSTTGGRIDKKDSKYGFHHVESALRRLQDGGRLVAVLGESALMDRTKSQEWWSGIAEKYNVKGLFQMPENSYYKYGTTFGTVVAIIDKDGPTPGGTWIERLKNIKQTNYPDFERTINEIDKLPRPIKKQNHGSVVEPAGDIRGGGGKPPRTPDRGSAVPGVGEPGERNVSVEPDRGSQKSTPAVQGGESGAGPGKERTVQPGGGAPEDVGRVTDAGIKFRKAEDAKRSDDSGGTFVQYKPAKLVGGKPHRGKIVESASMAAVEPPDITYIPQLPKHIIESGALSDLQLETVCYAGQQHQIILPSGHRAGYFLGDGTGVGKGRQVAAIIFDNYNQGRKRALWLSVSKDLYKDAQRDLEGVGAGHIPRALLNSYNIADKIDMPEGIVFSTYNTFISAKKGATDVSRMKQLVDWLGEDGVIILDESHKAKNALEQERGQASQTGQAVLDIQQIHLPKSYVVYSSATGATDVRNMAYMTRLGQWGEGASFEDFNDFMYAVEGGGIGAMEIVARDLKAYGKFCSRSLSYEGVEYDEVTHVLTPEQRKTYNSAAQAWQVVMQDVEAAIQTTGNNSKARAWAMQRFWTDHQRFFKQLIMASKVPTLIKQVEKEVADGNSVVIGLIGTGESRAAQKVSEAATEGKDLDDLDFTPREIIANYVDKSFPTTQYIDVQDPVTGKVVSVVMKDKNGNPVQSKEALRMKDKLLDDLSDITFPDNPLDQIVNHFGPDAVAELTGRKKRLIRNKKTGKMEYVKRAPEGVPMDKVNIYEMEQYQGGKKYIAIISDAASTGISLHSDLGAKNQRRRVHITLELGWSADKQLQTFGRSHRTNEANEPRYTLLSTDVGGEKRFSSTIGRRLASIGALTKGQKDATGTGDIAKYNYETAQGKSALRITYKAMLDEVEVPGLDNPKQALRDMGLLKQSQDGEKIKEQDMIDVPRFLNRMLSLDIDRQNALFDFFDTNFRQVIELEKESGTFDDGVSDIKGASNVKLKGRKLVSKDESTGAITEVITLNADFKTHPVSFEQAALEASRKPEGRFYQQRKSGNYVMAYKAGSKTDAETGKIVERVRVVRYNGNTELYDRNEMYFEFNEVEPYEAEKWWNEQFAKYPKTRTDEINLISGVMLPYWTKIVNAVSDSKMGKLKISRVITDDGQRFVGAQIPHGRVNAVLRSIGINRKIEDPVQVFNVVLNEKTTIPLEGGMKLVPARYSYQDVIEIEGVGQDRYDFLRDAGVINERMNWKQRFFIPNDEQTGPEVLKKVLKRWPTLGDDMNLSVLGINPLGMVAGFQQDEEGNWYYDVGLGAAGALATVLLGRAAWKAGNKAARRRLMKILDMQIKRVGKDEFKKVLDNHGILNKKIPYSKVRGIVDDLRKVKVKPAGVVGRMIEALKEAKPVRRKQETIYTKERGKRMGAAMGASRNFRGEARSRVILSKMKGEMGYADFETLRGKIAQEDIDEIFDMVWQHNTLSFWQKLSANGGLLKLFGEEGGRVPTEGEIILLNKVFGREFTEAMLSKRSLWEKAKDVGYEIANLPRALMASFDMSMPFRQGIVMTSRPKRFFGAFPAMVRSFGSEKAYTEVMNEISHRPNYQLMQDSKLDLTDLEAIMFQREEQFASNFAERIPGIGRVVRASGRSATAFTNKLRADVFDDLAKKARQMGLDPYENRDMMRSVATFINSATGRGTLKHPGNANFFNSVLFSPRLIKSRINMLNPAYYAKLDPFARKEALKSMLAFTGIVATTLGLAHMAGAEVTADPRSADFGKIKMGNTRVDITGGFGQYIRFIAQMTTGKLKSTTTGRTINISRNRNLTRLDIVTRFIENKEAPIASFATDWLRGYAKYDKKPFSPTKEIGERFVPMIIQDGIDIYKDDPTLLPLEALGFFGFGIQTYSKRR